jgi:hypothetical protein
MNYTDFVTAYQQLQQQAKLQSQPLTESVLRMSRTVHDAKKKLTPDDFIIFTRKTGLSGDTNTGRVKQLVKLGAKVDTLLPFAASLPPTVCALLPLTRFDKDGLNALIIRGAVTPFTTIETAKNLASEQAPRNSKRGRPEGTSNSDEFKEPVEEVVDTDASVNIAAIRIDTEGFRYHHVVAFLRELEAFTTDAAERYGFVDPKIRPSAYLTAVLKIKGPQAA